MPGPPPRFVVTTVHGAKNREVDNVCVSLVVPDPTEPGGAATFVVQRRHAGKIELHCFRHSKTSHRDK